MSDEQKPEVKPDVAVGGSEHINLKVTGSDRSVVHFKIKKNTPLRKLMTAYCERQGFQAGTVRFMFDGNQIGAEQTPIELEMEDDDTIEVFQQQTGGGDH
ncbi:Small ubiquitin-related modifier 2 [Geodia barretti]|uniref:Small ubiquitin-related modifier n=1 Tax=Geodia barretti TaxID=519541 RepID=A0AA35TPD4_GEOBA|nr:Small ubiquitin-related modifier 2 [Geodia barretti]